MSVVMTVIFLIVSDVVLRTRYLSPLREVVIPVIGQDLVYLIWLAGMAITAIFAIRALSDAVVIADVLTDIFVKRLGIKGEQTLRRAARDLIYIIVVILLATAISPIMITVGGDIGSWLLALTVYVALGVIIVLIYDIGRILYRIAELRAESFADRLSRIADQSESRQ